MSPTDTGVVVMPSEAERLARESGNKELHLWIKSSYRYSAARGPHLLLPTRPTPSSASSPLPPAALLQALHHVRVLTPQRAIGLLRAGCSPHAAMFQSPAELAREHEHDPRVPAAKIILRAAEPWSPDTH